MSKSDDDITVEIAPDLVRDDIKPLAVLSYLRLTDSEGNVTPFDDPGREVGIDGYKHTVRIKLKPDGAAKFEMAWWSWVNRNGESGFSVKRFAERFVVRVENRSSVVAKIALETFGKNFELRYGENYLVADLPKIPPKTRVEFFWRDPDPGQSSEVAGLGPTLPITTHPILDYDHKLGDRPTRSL